MEILILFVLVLINGIFAMSEMAIVSSRKARLQQRADNGSAGAQVALSLANDPGRFLSTIQVGITTIGILSGAFGESAIAERLIEVFKDYPAIAPYSKVAATAIMVVLVTYCSVVLGEIVPKRLALINPERVASVIARPMQVLSMLAHPLVVLFSVSSNALLKLLGGNRGLEQPVSAEEINLMLQEGAAAGVFERAEETMVGNVFRLDDLRVTAIMTPRLQIAYLDVNDSDDENHAVLIEGRFQTLPVCRAGLDEVLGFLDTKAFLAKSLRGEHANIAEVTHPPVFIPETVSLIRLLETLKKQNSHMALVVDEYGSVEGMVTLTDLLDAITGDLHADDSNSSEDAVQREDGSWLLDGRIAVDRVSSLLKLEQSLASPELGYSTLGGLVMDRVGHVPKTGDHFEWKGLRFEVVDMDANRVDRVLVQAAVAKS